MTSAHAQRPKSLGWYPVRISVRAHAPLVLLAGVYPLLQAVLALALPRAQLQMLFTDDAYYYLSIAEHIADGDGSTFGGLVPTNGYQPLWQLVLVPLAALAQGDALLRLVYVLEAVLFAVTVVLAYRIADTLGLRNRAAYAAAFMTLVGLVSGRLFFSGMEIALVVPAALLFVLLVLRLDLAPPTVGRGGAALGGAALLLGLSRLDSVVLPALVGLTVLVRGPRRARRRVLLAGAVLALGLGAYAGVNDALFDTALPVSGQAKALGGGSLDSSLVVQYLSDGDIGPLPLLLGTEVVAVSLIALGVLRTARRRGRPVTSCPAGDAAVGRLLVVLLAAQAAQLAYYTATSSWGVLWSWYLFYVPISTFLAGLVVVQALASRTRVTTPRGLGAVAVAAVVCALGGWSAVAYDGPDWQRDAPAAAGWITTHTTASDIVGVGDRAGYLMWLTGRRSVQLEGLVEDRPFLAAISRGALDDEMRSRRVTYYVRSQDLDRFAPTRPGPDGCTTFLEPAQGEGPKSAIRACVADEVYSAATSRFTWQVFRR